MNANGISQSLGDRPPDVHATWSFTIGGIYLRIKEKERKSIYIALFVYYVMYVSKRSGMDHTVLPKNYTMPAFSL